MAITRCPHCEVLILPEEARNGNCPSCGGSLDGRTPPRRPAPAASAAPGVTAPRGAAPPGRGGGITASLLLALLLLAVGFAAFTGYVAYCGMHPFQLPDAFEYPPRPDAPRLGAVLDAGLAWAMRACGVVVILLGAAFAVRAAAPTQALPSIVLVLAGAILVTQHWAAAVALAVVGAAAAGIAWRAPPSDGRA